MDKKIGRVMKKNVSKKLKFAVIGAGNGGQAIAGYLACRGHEVNLYNRTIKKIQRIKFRGYIDLEGCVNGRGRLKLVTESNRTSYKKYRYNYGCITCHCP